MFYSDYCSSPGASRKSDSLTHGQLPQLTTSASEKRLTSTKAEEPCRRPSMGTKKKRSKESSRPCSVYGYWYGTHFHSPLSVTLSPHCRRGQECSLPLPSPFAKLRQCSVSPSLPHPSPHSAPPSLPPPSNLLPPKRNRRITANCAHGSIQLLWPGPAQHSEEARGAQRMREEGDDCAGSSLRFFVSQPLSQQG